MTERSTQPSGMTILNPDTMGDPSRFAFSHVAVVPAGARTVLVAGQVGTGSPKGTFAEQVGQIFTSIGLAMEAAGGEICDVAKLVVYIVDHDAEKHEVLKATVNAAFGDRLAPTCTIVPLARSGLSSDQLVEIEATGVLPPEVLA